MTYTMYLVSLYTSIPIKIISSFLPAWLDEYLHEYVQDHLRYRPRRPPCVIRIASGIFFVNAIYLHLLTSF